MLSSKGQKLNLSTCGSCGIQQAVPFALPVSTWRVSYGDVSSGVTCGLCWIKLTKRIFLSIYLYSINVGRHGKKRQVRPDAVSFTSTFSSFPKKASHNIFRLTKARRVRAIQCSHRSIKCRR